MMKKLSVALLLIMLLFTSSFRVYAEGSADYGFTISEEEKRTLRSRNILQISISLLVLFAVVALIYAVWQAWLLMM